MIRVLALCIPLRYTGRYGYHDPGDGTTLYVLDRSGYGISCNADHILSRRTRRINVHKTRMTTSIGLSVEAIDRSVEALTQYLADSQVLYTKTQIFHWNIVSPDFLTLHEMLQQQYEDLAASIDETAERVRMLGRPISGTLAAALERSQLTEVAGTDMSDVAMLQAVGADHETLAQSLRTAIPAVQALGDEGTADYCIARLRQHEKTVWFITSTIAGR